MVFVFKRCLFCKHAHELHTAHTKHPPLELRFSLLGHLLLRPVLCVPLARQGTAGRLLQVLLLPGLRL